MMWQIGLTVVSVENFTQIRFRHRSLLERADRVLVMCLGQHYVPARKYIVIIYSYCARLELLRSDGYIMHSDGYTLRSDGCSAVLPS